MKQVKDFQILDKSFMNDIHKEKVLEVLFENAYLQGKIDYLTNNNEAA